jgi:hypothetical protein
MFKPVKYDLLAVKARALVEGRSLGASSAITESASATLPVAVPTADSLMANYAKLPLANSKHARTLSKLDWSSLADPPNSVRRFAEQLFAATNDEQDALPPSVDWIWPVIALPINESMRAIGAPFKLLTRKLSEQRIELVHTRAVDSANLLLQFRDTAVGEVDVTVTVLECQRDAPFFRIYTATCDAPQS